MSFQENVVLGIDLGTTNSCVAVHRESGTEVFKNLSSGTTIPSYVYFDNGHPTIGSFAKRVAGNKPGLVVFDAKRLIGRKGSNLTDDIKEDIKNWPFTVKVDEKGRLYYQIGPDVKMFPEQISQLVLSEMKRVAELSLEFPVKKAVITVPAYFNDDQRRATKHAAELAGLEVLRLINEPTAAALGYGMSKMKSGDKNKYICVYDLGGGTFDVSIVSVNNGLVNVESTDGISHLGGRDFDKIIYDHVANELMEKHKIKLSELDAKVRASLMQNCELAKCDLSTVTSTEVTIPRILPGDKNFDLQIRRTEFEEMIAPLLKRTEQCVSNAVDEAKLSFNQIDEIILVGGSARIPKIETMLKLLFNRDRVNKSMNGDEVVAVGAAIMGAFLSGAPIASTLGLVDVNSLSIGIMVEGGRFSRIIDKNTCLPATRHRPYSNACDNQKGASIKIYQGEGRWAEENLLLGTFTLVDLPPAPRGSLKIVVTMKINRNGMIMVTAEIAGSDKKKSIEVRHDRDLYSSGELQQMEKAAADFKEEAQRRYTVNKERSDMHNRLSYTMAYYNQESVKKAMDANVRNKAVGCCFETLTWLNRERNPTFAQLQEKSLQVEKFMKDLLNKDNTDNDNDNKRERATSGEPLPKKSRNMD